MSRWWQEETLVPVEPGLAAFREGQLTRASVDGGWAEIVGVRANCGDPTMCLGGPVCPAVERYGECLGILDLGVGHTLHLATEVGPRPVREPMPITGPSGQETAEALLWVARVLQGLGDPIQVTVTVEPGSADPLVRMAEGDRLDILGRLAAAVGAQLQDRQLSRFDAVRVGERVSPALRLRVKTPVTAQAVCGCGQLCTHRAP